MIHDMDQRSAEWMRIRLGKATASRVSDIIARTKSGYSASRANYAAQLVCERLTGVQAETYTNAAMQWGCDNEDAAREAYEFAQAVTAEQVGFVDHPMVSMAGASPDGLVGDDGLIEIKCPNTATHIETLLTGSIADKYIVQMQWQLGCTNRKWCDFVSYDPRLSEEKRLFVKRVHRDDARIAELEAEVGKFLAEVEDTIARLNAAYPAANDLSDFVSDEKVAMLRAG
jgi:putative phage-type endonuclease